MTIDQIKAANERAGFFFFSKDTMRFFKSRVLPTVYEGPGGVFFVTSESGFFKDGARHYTVREFNPKTGDVKTADETRFATRAYATGLAKVLAEEKRKPTLLEFIIDQELSLDVERVNANPNMPDWKTARHFLCTLKKNGASLWFYFSQGAAHTVNPSLSDVLDCLASDASGAVHTTFEDWASNYGYDTDSRKAERTYATIQRQTAELFTLLGNEAFNTLLYDIERP